MKLRTLALLFALSTLALADTKNYLKKRWSELHGYVVSQYVEVTRTDGSVIRGQVRAMDATKLMISSGEPGARAQDIDRGVIFRITVLHREPQLPRLGRVAGHGLHEGFHRMFSTRALEGVVIVPVVAAYAVATAPFCALGDLFASDQKRQDIELVP